MWWRQEAAEIPYVTYSVQVLFNAQYKWCKEENFYGTYALKFLSLFEKIFHFLDLSQFLQYIHEDKITKERCTISTILTLQCALLKR
jgi:hypothetical protein